MKFYKKVLLGLCLTLFTGCEFIPYDQGTNIEFKVIDKATKKPVGDAYVQLQVASRYYINEAGGKNSEKFFLKTGTDGKVVVHSKYSVPSLLKINHKDYHYYWDERVYPRFELKIPKKIELVSILDAPPPLTEAQLIISDKRGAPFGGVNVTGKIILFDPSRSPYKGAAISQAYKHKDESWCDLDLDPAFCRIIFEKLPDLFDKGQMVVLEDFSQVKKSESYWVKRLPLLILNASEKKSTFLVRNNCGDRITDQGRFVIEPGQILVDEVNVGLDMLGDDAPFKSDGAGPVCAVELLTGDEIIDSQHVTFHKE